MTFTKSNKFAECPCRQGSVTAPRFFYWNKYKIFLDKLKPTFIIINMNKLNEILYQKRITKAELARKLKISPQRVNNWTCGNNYPNRKYTKLIAEYLDVSIEKLFYDEEENK